MQIKRGIKMRRYFGALAIGLIGLAVSTGPAISVPAGSYQQTCSDIRMEGSTLHASCLTFDQHSHDTSLAFADSCVGVISNVNGVLACTGPVGSYAETCRDAMVSGQTLSATCRKRDQSEMQSSVTFSGFQHPVTNCDGQLVDRPNC